MFHQDETQFGGTLTSIERSHYLKLYEQLVSRKHDIDYPLITQQILEMIIIEVHKEIETLDYPEIKKGQMLRDVSLIISSINPDDTNYIGKINIISLQFIILFTENCFDPTIVFPVNLNDNYKDYLQLRKGDWKNYDVICENLKINPKFRILYSNSIYSIVPYTTSENENTNIYLITIMKYFTIDEILNSYLNNVFYCGITYNFTYADGRELTPFEFLEHDIVHAENYNYACFGGMGLSRKHIKSFYEYCVTTTLKKSEKYAIKFMLFLLIHESMCDYFPIKKYDIERINKDLIEYSLFNDRLSRIERFINLNDLGKSIPIEYRENMSTILKYINYASGIYIRELKKWGPIYNDKSWIM
jgi:hypothetical protein